MPYLIKEVPCQSNADWKAKFWDIYKAEVETVKIDGVKYDKIKGILGAWAKLTDMQDRKIPPVGSVTFDYTIMRNDTLTTPQIILQLFQKFKESALNKDDQETNTFSCCGGLDSCGQPINFVNDTLVTE